MKRWRVPLAGVLGAVVLTAVYVMAFHQPRADQIADLRADANGLRAQQVTLQRSIAALETVEAREPEFTSALQVLERLIPSGLGQPDFLVHLQAAAQSTGVQLVSVTFGDPSVPKDAPPSAVEGTVLVAMPVTVVVDGPYAGITNMLGRIETATSRAVLVGEVALTEAQAGFPRLTGTWSGQAYALLPRDDPLLPDAKATGTTPAPAPTPTSPDRTNP